MKNVIKLSDLKSRLIQHINIIAGDSIGDCLKAISYHNAIMTDGILSTTLPIEEIDESAEEIRTQVACIKFILSELRSLTGKIEYAEDLYSLIFVLESSDSPILTEYEKVMGEILQITIITNE